MVGGFLIPIRKQNTLNRLTYSGVDSVGRCLEIFFVELYAYEVAASPMAGYPRITGAVDLVYVADRTADPCGECFFDWCSKECTEAECFMGLHLEEVSVNKQKITDAALKEIAEDFKSSELHDFGAGAYDIEIDGELFHVSVLRRENLDEVKK